MTQERYKKTACAGGWSGNVLFSRRATPQVSSGLKGFDSRVRDGNGCFPFAIVTTPPACTSFAVSWILQYPGSDRVCPEREHPGGDEGIRTPDLRRAKAALFQLSYVPVS